MSQDAATAYLLAPEDGRIAALLAASLVESGLGSGKQLAPADDLARGALRSDATAVAAVSTLGIIAQLRNDSALAGRRFGYAERLSRRNLAAQLWAIEDNVAKENIAGALHHYDLALRATPASADILFPVLSSAISDPEVRKSLTAILRSKPNWVGNLTKHLSINGPEPVATSQLFIDLMRADVSIPTADNAALIQSLVKHGDLEVAWQYYSILRPASVRDALRDPHFTREVANASLFDWQVGTAPGVSAYTQAKGSVGTLQFTVESATGGVIVQQMQMLPTGRYTLLWASEGIQNPVSSSLKWILTCDDGRELGRYSFADSVVKGKFHSALFDVPSSCRAQVLALHVDANDGQVELNGALDEVYLVPKKPVVVPKDDAGRL